MSEKDVKPVDLEALETSMNTAWAKYGELWDAYEADGSAETDTAQKEAYKVYKAAKKAFTEAGGMIEEMDIPKEELSLAGEYAVASELCRRGYYAQLTLGNRKKTDILLDDGTRVIKIQVKAKQGERWPSIKGVAKKDDNTVLVLVDYENKKIGEPPVFYVLTSADWEYFIKHDLASDVSTGRFRVDDDNVPIFVNKSGKDSWQGIALYPANVSTNKERWDKIKALLKARE